MISVILPTYNNEQTIFSLNKLDHAASGSSLLKDDIRVSRTLDDSGTAFELIFNSRITDFYFLLDKNNSAPDDFINLSPNIMLSRRTGFVYYHKASSNRYVLVGVNQEEVFLNSANDGPFDHLAENDFLETDFWKFVYQTYPDMIDNHTPGGTVNDEGMIFSLRPYRLYQQISDLGFIENCRINEKLEIDKIACMIWGISKTSKASN